MNTSPCSSLSVRKPSTETKVRNSEHGTDEDELDPRDKGWAWVVAIAIGTFNMLLDGTSKSNGLLYLEWLQLHRQNPAITAWVRTSYSLVQIVTTPISAYLRDRLTFHKTRLIIFIGGIIWALSFCVAGWMPNVEGIIVSYSLFGGIASGLIITPIFSSIPDYFVKRRSLASGIALGGGSVGGLVVPILVASLTETYSIRGTMTIIGGLYLHTLVVAAVMIPLRKPKVKVTKMEPTAGQGCRGNNDMQSEKGASRVNEAFELEEAENVELRSINQTDVITSVVEDGGSQTHPELYCSRVNLEKSTPKSKESSAVAPCEDTELHTSKSIEESKSNESTLTSQPARIQSDSETEIPKNNSSPNSRQADLIAKIRNLKMVKLTVSYIDFVRTPHMIPLALTFLCASFAYFSQFLVLVPFATDLGGSKVMASTVISIMSVTELFGRLLTGYIADRLGRNKLWLLFLSYVTSFTIGIFIVIFPSKNLLYAYAVVFGIFGGMYMPLTIPMATDLVSSNQFGKATGLLPVVVGLGIAIGNQAATAVYEKTNSYKYSLLLCVCMYLGALLFFGIYALGVYRKRSEEKAVKRA